MIWHRVPRRKSGVGLKTSGQRIFSRAKCYLCFLLVRGFELAAGQNLTDRAGENATITVSWQFSFGKAGSGVGQFKNPQAISVDPQGSIYVCDTDNHRIQKFDTQGVFQRQIGGFGWGREQFYQPMDIQARSALDIFIADFQNQRIERYDRELNYLSSLHSDGANGERLQFTRPIGIAFSQQRELFIVDDENQRVLKMNSQGAAEFFFGDFKWGQGNLQRPRQIEVAQDERVLVVDEAAAAIFVFDYFGNFLTLWGQSLLAKPRGIFWDVRDWLFIADTGHHRFVILDQTGNCLFALNPLETTAPPLLEPADIAVFKNQIFVLDASAACVQVYRFTHRATTTPK